MSNPGVSFLFSVYLDGLEFTFTKLEGLSAKYETETVKEGGQNTYVHQLLGRMTYENVKLTRPVDDKSHELAKKFIELQQNMAKGTSTSRLTASISLYESNFGVSGQWDLIDVYPVRYQGPSMGAGQNQVVSETIELAHNGFWTVSVGAAPTAKSLGGRVLSSAKGKASTMAKRTATGQARGATPPAVGQARGAVGRLP